jgi:hypothetical protein
MHRYAQDKLLSTARLPREPVMPPISQCHNGEQLKQKIPLKTKVIPVTGLGGLQDCGMLKLPHCLDNRLTDGGKGCQPEAPAALYTPETSLFFCFWYSFLLEA